MWQKQNKKNGDIIENSVQIIDTNISKSTSILISGVTESAL